MKGTRFTQERIIGILKEADCKTSTIGELCRKHGVSEQTFYRWRRKYGGVSVSEARRLKDLEKENARLKKLVADISLDNAILKDVAEGNL